jgi:transposase
MSTSLLYHGFGIVGYRYVRTEYREGDVIFTISKAKFRSCCPVCKSRRVIKHGSLPRWFHSLPIGRKATYIKTEIPRLECKACKAIRQADIGFADSRLTYTKALGRYVLDLAKYMTISDVSRHLRLSWDVVKSIQKRHLQRKYAKPNLRELEQIAIDEIYVGKSRYFTIVLDIASGAVIFVGDGKGSDALEPFWQRLLRHRRKVKIKAVAIDMSPAYVKAVRENLKDAVIVFDHFHVIKLFNEKISDFRRQLYNNIEDKLQRSVIKGTRWLLLTGKEKLKDSIERTQRLRQALEINKPLATVYYMKEDLRQLWSWTEKKTATWHLKSWISMARNSGIVMLEKFATTLEEHFEGLLAYFDFNCLSTGPLEGTNNKIKTMQRKAYGYRDMEFFKLKIMALHETKYALVG